MADDKATVAVDEVAKRVIHIILNAESVYEEWENHPEIGEHDWNAVVYRIRQLADDINPDDAVYDAAYEFLKDRAEDE